MKKTFQQFLKEESAWIPKEMEPEEIISWCETHAKEFLKNRWHIWRGTDTMLTGLLDTKHLNRRSANTSNHYTLWLDNSEKWATYPKRSESIICTTNINTANAFGEIYYVIPEDSAKIGICPLDDFWDSFGERRPVHVNRYLRSVEISDASWEQMIKDIKNFEPEFTNQSQSDIISFMKSQETSVLEKALDNYFDPVKNNFKSILAKDKLGSKYRDNELWVSGKVMLVSKNSDKYQSVVKFIKGDS